MTLCSLPRTNPGNRLQYKRANDPYRLVAPRAGAWIDTNVYLDTFPQSPDCPYCIRLGLSFMAGRCTDGPEIASQYGELC